MFNYRIEWIDFITKKRCVDFLSERGAIYEAKNDVLGEIYSITKITWISEDECIESENLLEIFKKM